MCHGWANRVYSSYERRYNFETILYFLPSVFYFLFCFVDGHQTWCQGKVGDICTYVASFLGILYYWVLLAATTKLLKKEIVVAVVGLDVKRQFNQQFLRSMWTIDSCPGLYPVWPTSHSHVTPTLKRKQSLSLYEVPTHTNVDGYRAPFQP